MKTRKNPKQAESATPKVKNTSGAGIAPAAETEQSGKDYSSNAVNLRRADWRFLRRVAEARSDARLNSGLPAGRPSVSKVIESLIDQNRDKLRSEL